MEGSQREEPVSEQVSKSPPLPPRWFIRVAWAVHRAIYRLSGGRRGLRPPTATNWGTLRLETIGRRSGRRRYAILGYYEDGPNLVTTAMNGWQEGEPGWWVNLQEHPEATVVLPDGPRRVRGRAALGAERDRLWDRWREIEANLDGYATRRSATAVVVLEPAHDGP
jgi:deazaflavin-dependent oxidoreductase (nitroreductase family)